MYTVKGALRAYKKLFAGALRTIIKEEPINE